MTKNTNQLDQIPKTNPFKVPEGYFEGLTTQIMSNLPEKVEQETKTVSLWNRAKPWVYMAAMFIGIALMVKVFVDPMSQDSTFGSLSLASSSEVEEFYDYYEEQSLADVYAEVYYSEEGDF